MAYSTIAQSFILNHDTCKILQDYKIPKTMETLAYIFSIWRSFPGCLMSYVVEREVADFSVNSPRFGIADAAPRAQRQMRNTE